MKTDNNTTTATTKKVPFFAQKQEGKTLVIKTRIQAGAGAREESVK